MAWFHEDPRRLGGTLPIVSHGNSATGASKGGRGATISVTELHSRDALRASSSTAAGVSGQRWSRFMELVFAAFRELREPFGSTSAGRRGEDDEDVDPMSRVKLPPFPPRSNAHSSISNDSSIGCSPPRARLPTF